MLNEFSFTTTYHLPKFIESPSATEAAEDWSKVRSPARAKRRMKRGFPQNVIHYRKPACYFNELENSYYIHPELMKEWRRKTGEAGKRMQQDFDQYFYNSFSGGAA